MVVERFDQKYPIFCLRDFSFITGVLVTLNFLDVILSKYATNILGLVELNPLASGFPIWLLMLKFGVCFVPLVCAYALDKSGMENFMFLPFTFLTILIGFYTFVVSSSVRNILGF